jgi:hypothetical protein
MRAGQRFCSETGLTEATPKGSIYVVAVVSYEHT